MGGPLIVGGAAAAFMAWAVRGRSSPVFGPSVWRGPVDRRVIALTFDDGPGQGTPALLEILARYGVPATFFVCGMHVRRRPRVVQEMIAAGHELGNHTDTHPPLWLRSPDFVYGQIRRAQESIADATGIYARWFRPTYGVRWFGMNAALREFGLTTAMWTTIARDWTLEGPAVAERLMEGAANGGILCLHDGREKDSEAPIISTLEGVRKAVPRLLEAGWQFATLTQLIGVQ